MSVTITRFLDTRRFNNTNDYPIKYRLTFERKSKEYQSVFNLSKEDFEKLSFPRINKSLQEIKDDLKEIDRILDLFIKENTRFSFGMFENMILEDNKYFIQRKRSVEILPSISDVRDFDYAPFLKKFPILCERFNDPQTIGYAFLTTIKKLIREGRIGTVVTNHGSYASLNKFKGNVKFKEVTPGFLREYENWLVNKNVSKSTINIYLLPFRAIFNEAIQNGIIKQEHYPFGKRKYQIPNAKNIKKALDLDDIKKIYYYQCDPLNESEQKAKDFWLFSYYSNGMNPKDIANLKY